MHFLSKQTSARIIALIAVVCAAGILGCGGSSNEDPVQTNKAEEIDMAAPEYASAYVCPMHCEGSGSDQPGKCPVCGMDYVPRAEDQADRSQ
jgi:hypothetical protein